MARSVGSESQCSRQKCRCAKKADPKVIGGGECSTGPPIGDGGVLKIGEVDFGSAKAACRQPLNAFTAAT